MAHNYYELLGVNQSASDKEIKTAYRRMARKLHPDVNPDNERAQVLFKKVNEAYEVVGDPNRRKDYDQFGDNWKHADQMRNMGGVASLLDKLPGASELTKEQRAQVNDGELLRTEAIINSMTPHERRRPAVINGSRKRRIATGSGTRIQDVNKVLKQVTQMQKMMKRMSKKGMGRGMSLPSFG